MRLARLFQRAAAFNLPRRAVFPAALPRPAALRRLATVGTPAPETAKPAEMQKAAETGPLKTTIYVRCSNRAAYQEVADGTVLTM